MTVHKIEPKSAVEPTRDDISRSGEADRHEQVSEDDNRLRDATASTSSEESISVTATGESASGTVQASLENEANNRLNSPQPRTKKKSKTVVIDSFGGLLRTVYDGSFKRSNLLKTEIVAINDGPTGYDLDALRSIVEADRTLLRTKQLMLIGTKLSKGERARISAFAAHVLRGHPAFQNIRSAVMLGTDQDPLTEDQAINKLVFQDFASFRWAEGMAPMKKVEADQCKKNALYCLLLHFWLTSKVPLNGIHEQLQTRLWIREAKKYKNDADRITALIVNRDVGPATIVYALLRSEITEALERLGDTRESERRTLVREERLKDKLSEVEVQLAETLAQSAGFESELKELSAKYDNDRAHWIDDMEAQRGRVLGRLREEVKLLDEGLHALRRDPPKVHVMIDHAERAMDGLKKEIDKLGSV